MKARLYKKFKEKSDACEYVRDHPEKLIVIRRGGDFLAVLPEVNAGERKSYPADIVEEAKRCGLKPCNYLLALNQLGQILKLRGAGQNMHQIARQIGSDWSRVRTVICKYDEGLLDHLAK